MLPGAHALAAVWLASWAGAFAAGATVAALAGLVAWAAWAAARKRRTSAQGRTPTPEFVARMGHELRTPLNSVIGFSNVLLRNSGSNLSTQQMLYLSRIRDNGVHLLALVDHLLDASDQGTGAQRVRLTPVSVERLVRGTLEEMALEAAQDNVTLETELPLDLLPLTTDEHRFGVALHSLVHGALPLAGQGSMTVRVAARHGHPQRIEVAVTSPVSVEASATTLLPAELTLATSLYHLLGYPVTTEQQAGRGGATISVMLDTPLVSERPPVS